MFTHYESLRLYKELRLFFVLSNRLMRSFVRLLFLLATGGGELLYALFAPPQLIRRNDAEDFEGSSVNLPSQSPKWVFGQMPVGLDSER